MENFLGNAGQFFQGIPSSTRVYGGSALRDDNHAPPTPTPPATPTLPPAHYHPYSQSVAAAAMSATSVPGLLPPSRPMTPVTPSHKPPDHGTSPSSYSVASFLQPQISKPTSLEARHLAAQFDQQFRQAAISAPVVVSATATRPSASSYNPRTASQSHNNGQTGHGTESRLPSHNYSSLASTISADGRTHQPVLTTQAPSTEGRHPRFYNTTSSLPNEYRAYPHSYVSQNSSDPRGGPIDSKHFPRPESRPPDSRISEARQDPRANLHQEQWSPYRTGDTKGMERLVPSVHIAEASASVNGSKDALYLGKKTGDIGSIRHPDNSFIGKNMESLQVNGSRDPLYPNGSHSINTSEVKREPSSERKTESRPKEDSALDLSVKTVRQTPDSTALDPEKCHSNSSSLDVASLEKTSMKDPQRRTPSSVPVSSPYSRVPNKDSSPSQVSELIKTATGASGTARMVSPSHLIQYGVTGSPRPLQSPSPMGRPSHMLPPTKRVGDPPYFDHVPKHPKLTHTPPIKYPPRHVAEGQFTDHLRERPPSSSHKDAMSEQSRILQIAPSVTIGKDLDIRYSGESIIEKRSLYPEARDPGFDWRERRDLSSDRREHERKDPTIEVRRDLIEKREPSLGKGDSSRKDLLSEVKNPHHEKRENFSMDPKFAYGKHLAGLAPSSDPYRNWMSAEQAKINSELIERQKYMPGHHPVPTSVPTSLPQQSPRPPPAQFHPYSSYRPPPDTRLPQIPYSQVGPAAVHAHPSSQLHSSQSTPAKMHQSYVQQPPSTRPGQIPSTQSSSHPSHSQASAGQLNSGNQSHQYPYPYSTTVAAHIAQQHRQQQRPPSAYPPFSLPQTTRPSSTSSASLPPPLTPQPAHQAYMYAQHRSDPSLPMYPSKRSNQLSPHPSGSPHPSVSPHSSASPNTSVSPHPAASPHHRISSPRSSVSPHLGQQSRISSQYSPHASQRPPSASLHGYPGSLPPSPYSAPQAHSSYTTPSSKHSSATSLPSPSSQAQHPYVSQTSNPPQSPSHSLPSSTSHPLPGYPPSSQSKSQGPLPTHSPHSRPPSQTQQSSQAQPASSSTSTSMSQSHASLPPTTHRTQANMYSQPHHTWATAAQMYGGHMPKPADGHATQIHPSHAYPPQGYAHYPPTSAKPSHSALPHTHSQHPSLPPLHSSQGPPLSHSSQAPVQHSLQPNSSSYSQAHTTHTLSHPSTHPSQTHPSHPPQAHPSHPPQAHPATAAHHPSHPHQAHPATVAHQAHSLPPPQGPPHHPSQSHPPHPSQAPPPSKSHPPHSQSQHSHSSQAPQTHTHPSGTLPHPAPSPQHPTSAPAHHPSPTPSHHPSPATHHPSQLPPAHHPPGAHHSSTGPPSHHPPSAPHHPPSAHHTSTAAAPHHPSTAPPSHHPSAAPPSHHPSTTAAPHHPSTTAAPHHPSTVAPSHHPSTAAAPHHPSTAPPSQHPSTAPASHHPSTAPPSHHSSTAPASHHPSTAPPSHHSSTAPASHHPSTAPPSHHPSTAPASHHPSTAPPSHHPSTVPPSHHPSTAPPSHHPSTATSQHSSAVIPPHHPSPSPAPSHHPSSAPHPNSSTAPSPHSSSAPPSHHSTAAPPSHRPSTAPSSHHHPSLPPHHTSASPSHHHPQGHPTHHPPQGPPTHQPLQGPPAHHLPQPSSTHHPSQGPAHHPPQASSAHHPPQASSAHHPLQGPPTHHPPQATPPHSSQSHQGRPTQAVPTHPRSSPAHAQHPMQSQGSHPSHSQPPYPSQTAHAHPSQASHPSQPPHTLLHTSQSHTQPSSQASPAQPAQTYPQQAHPAQSQSHPGHPHPSQIYPGYPSHAYPLHAGSSQGLNHPSSSQAHHSHLHQQPHSPRGHPSQSQMQAHSQAHSPRGHSAQPHSPRGHSPRGIPSQPHPSTGHPHAYPSQEYPPQAHPSQDNPMHPYAPHGHPSHLQMRLPYTSPIRPPYPPSTQSQTLHSQQNPNPYPPHPHAPRSAPGHPSDPSQPHPHPAYPHLGQHPYYPHQQLSHPSAKTEGLPAGGQYPGYPYPPSHPNGRNEMAPDRIAAYHPTQQPPPSGSTSPRSAQDYDPSRIRTKGEQKSFDPRSAENRTVSSKPESQSSYYSDQKLTELQPAKGEPKDQNAVAAQGPASSSLESEKNAVVPCKEEGGGENKLEQAQTANKTLEPGKAALAVKLHKKLQHAESMESLVAKKENIPEKVTPKEEPVEDEWGKGFDKLMDDLAANPEGVTSRKCRNLGRRYLQKVQIQNAINSDLIVPPLLALEEEEEDSEPEAPVKFRGKFKSIKDKKVERLILTYASHSDESAVDMIPDDDASDFEEELKREIRLKSKKRAHLKKKTTGDSSSGSEVENTSKKRGNVRGMNKENKPNNRQDSDYSLSSRSSSSELSDSDSSDDSDSEETDSEDSVRPGRKGKNADKKKTKGGRKWDSDSSDSEEEVMPKRRTRRTRKFSSDEDSFKPSRRSKKRRKKQQDSSESDDMPVKKRRGKKKSESEEEEEEEELVTRRGKKKGSLNKKRRKAQKDDSDDDSESELPRKTRGMKKKIQDDKKGKRRKVPVSSSESEDVTVKKNKKKMDGRKLGKKRRDKCVEDSSDDSEILTKKKSSPKTNVIVDSDESDANMNKKAEPKVVEEQESSKEESNVLDKEKDLVQKEVADETELQDDYAFEEDLEEDDKEPDSVIEKLKTIRDEEQNREDVQEMRSWLVEVNREVRKQLQDIAFRQYWKKPPFGGGEDFHHGWQSEVKKYKEKTARFPKKLCHATKHQVQTSPVAKGSPRKTRDQDAAKESPKRVSSPAKNTRSKSGLIKTSMAVAEDERLKVAARPEISSVMQRFFEKVLAEKVLVDPGSDSLKEESSCRKFNLGPFSAYGTQRMPTGLTPTPSVAPSMLASDDSDLDSLASIRTDLPASDSVPVSRRSIASSLLKKIGRKYNDKKTSPLFLNKTRGILEVSNKPQLLPTPGLPGSEKESEEVSPSQLKMSQFFRRETVENYKGNFEHFVSKNGINEFTPVLFHSRTRNKTKQIQDAATIKAVFGFDIPPHILKKNKLKKAKKIVKKSDKKEETKKEESPSVPISRASTPGGLMLAVGDEDDDSELRSERSESVLGESSVAHVPKRGRRKLRKFRSGFDYIRKKKKVKPDDEATPSRKRFPVRKQVNWPEQSRDVASEVRAWVVNKGLGETVLHKAARLGYHDVVVYCAESPDFDINVRDNAGYTPLHEACNRGHLDIAQVLCVHGAQVNAPGYKGMRPLHEAVENGHGELARLLLAYGADPTLTTYAGQTCLALSPDIQTSKLIEGFMADLKGHRTTEKWYFPGPGSFLDPEEQGCDIFGSIPGSNTLRSAENYDINEDSNKCDTMPLENSSVDGSAKCQNTTKSDTDNTVTKPTNLVSEVTEPSSSSKTISNDLKEPEKSEGVVCSNKESDSDLALEIKQEKVDEPEETQIDTIANEKTVEDEVKTEEESDSEWESVQLLFQASEALMLDLYEIEGRPYRYHLLLDLLMHLKMSYKEFVMLAKTVETLELSVDEFESRAHNCILGSGGRDIVDNCSCVVLVKVTPAIEKLLGLETVKL